MSNHNVPDLTVDELEALEYHGCSSGTSTQPMIRDGIVRACREIRRQRAAQLVEDERVRQVVKTVLDEASCWSRVDGFADRITERIVSEFMASGAVASRVAEALSGTGVPSVYEGTSAATEPPRDAYCSKDGGGCSLHPRGCPGRAPVPSHDSSMEALRREVKRYRGVMARLEELIEGCTSSDAAPMTAAQVVQAVALRMQALPTAELWQVPVLKDAEHAYRVIVDSSKAPLSRHAIDKEFTLERVIEAIAEIAVAKLMAGSVTSSEREPLDVSLPEGL